MTTAHRLVNLGLGLCAAGTVACGLLMRSWELTTAGVLMLVYVVLLWVGQRIAQRDTKPDKRPRLDGDVLDAWPFYSRAARRRLGVGRAEYGDRSFSRHPVELLDELADEALDMGGWGYVLWNRIQRAREAAALIEDEREDA